MRRKSCSVPCSDSFPTRTVVFRRVMLPVYHRNSDRNSRLAPLQRSGTHTGDGDNDDDRHPPSEAFPTLILVPLL